jgi:hypothetical protein
VVDAQQLGEGAGLGVGFLGGEDGVAEPLVASRDDFFKERLVEDVGGVVHAQPARRERGHRFDSHALPPLLFRAAGVYSFSATETFPFRHFATATIRLALSRIVTVIKRCLIASFFLA